jgi:hypothetical protein
MRKHVQRYRTEGFCIVRGLLPAKACRRVLREMDAVVAGQLETVGLPARPFRDEDSLHRNMQRLFAADRDVYLAAVRHLNKLLSVQQLLVHEKILSVTAELGLALPSVPTGPVVSIMSDKLRIPGGYFGLAPHQDWTSMQGSLDAVVVWTPLTRVARKNFPLELIPGSHVRGVWDGDNTDSAREIRPDLYQDGDFVPLEARPGDVAFLTSFTVHRTGTRRGARECAGLRIACNSRLENSAEPTFARRHFPCAYKRSVERELITPGFPTAEQVVRAIAGEPSDGGMQRCG